MELMPSSIAATIPNLYETEDIPLAEKIVRLKLFTPWSRWTWFVVEYDPKRRLCWGLVVGLETEWGYFSLDELEAIQGPAGLRIERDIHFRPQAVRQLIQTERIGGRYDLPLKFGSRK